jgi:hypothetical protein
LEAIPKSVAAALLWVSGALLGLISFASSSGNFSPAGIGQKEISSSGGFGLGGIFKGRELNSSPHAPRRR